MQMNYSIQANEEKQKVVFMPVSNPQYVQAPQPVPGSIPVPFNHELQSAKDDVEKSKKRLKCLNWTLIIYGMWGVMQGVIFGVVCRKCAAGFIKKGSEAHGIPYDDNVVSRDEYVLHEAFKNVALFMFLYNILIAMKGKCGNWIITQTKPEMIGSMRKKGIITTILITLFMQAVGYQFCSTADIFAKYKVHHEWKWSSWGQKTEDVPAVEEKSAFQDVDWEDVSKRNLQEDNSNHHSHHGHHGHHDDKPKKEGMPTSVAIQLAILYAVLAAQFWIMGTLKNGLEKVEQLTPKEQPVAPVEQQVPIIVSAPTVVSQPVFEIREEPSLIAKSNNNMV